MKQNIPIHDFSADDASSIPFKIISLNTLGHYDTSVPHRHNYYEIFILFKGGGTHEIDFVTYPIEDNCIHYVSPGQVHHVKRELDTFGYVILFSRDFYSIVAEKKDLLFDLPFLNNNGAKPVFNISENEMAIIKPILKTMEEESQSDLIHNHEIIRSYLNVLLLQSNRFFMQQNPEVNNENNDTLFNRFRILLEKKFSKLHKVKEFAEELGTSEKTLNEHCKKISGKTASEHIYNRIILEAKRLLKHSDQSTKEIAFFLNFHDPAHFNKFFRKQVGKSPGDFRAE